MGILAGKASHFVLSKLGRGSTLPGKIALKFDKDIPYKDGEIGKTGTIDSPDVIVINDTDPVDDFDGPVLKDIKLEKFMYEDSETICKKSCFQHGF